MDLENQEIIEDVIENENENSNTEIENEEINETSSEKEDRVPLNKYLQEKKKRREIERRLREIEEKTMSYESKQSVDKFKEKVLENGFGEDVATLFGDLYNEITKSLPKVDKVEHDILEDIQDYADENPEILKYKKEIVDKVKKYRKADPDFSIEDALSLIKPSKVRYSEIKTDVEQKQAMERRKVEGKKVATSTGSSPKNPYPLDEVDIKALEGLQKMQPDKGWTAEKYYKSRYAK